jgi:hypothetical protein
MEARMLIRSTIVAAALLALTVVDAGRRRWHDRRPSQ